MDAETGSGKKNALGFRGVSKPAVMACPEILKQLGKRGNLTLGQLRPTALETPQSDLTDQECHGEQDNRNTGHDEKPPPKNVDAPLAQALVLRSCGL